MRAAQVLSITSPHPAVRSRLNDKKVGAGFPPISRWRETKRQMPTPRQRRPGRPCCDDSPPPSFATRSPSRTWPAPLQRAGRAPRRSGLRTTSEQSGGTGPPGKGLRRKHLRNVRKELAGRSYQFLVGHANIGSHLHRVGLIDDDTCWWCDTEERQTRFHIVARCPRWGGQERALWKRVGKLSKCQNVVRECRFGNAGSGIGRLPVTFRTNLLATDPLMTDDSMSR